MISDAQMLDFATAVAKAFELVGIAAIIAGSLLAFGRLGVGALWTHGPLARERSALIPEFRRMLGRSILVGLELLVAADIIRTVAVEPTLESVMVLGGIVIIRTFLSFSLEVEIDGRWPWNAKKDADAG
ncbi:DUF1622 domain-containing protein [Aurantiacibacter suaedae]|uniref:DUF1622 domain-containing protein n=1 Tax=Aurantiacibacter suaedae TaxID=2545755 RepID=UPI001F4F610F|nr:DUF1622 domain-containing protein [Aurantiacibacter suaedae]